MNLKLKIIAFFFLSFFIYSEVCTVSAPPIAESYFFSQIKSINLEENEVVIYIKESCFKYDLDYRSEASYSAIPIMTFVYNPKKWILKEGDNENQILISKKDENKIIFLIGNNEYKYLPDKKSKNTITFEKSYVVENSETKINIKPAKIEDIYRKQLGDFLKWQMKLTKRKNG